MPDPTNSPPPTDTAPAASAAATAPAAPAAPADAAAGGASLLGSAAPPAAAAPGDGKPADAPKADDGKPASVGAPEKYADFTQPQGMTLSAEGMQAFADFAKTQNLSQEGAQAFMDKMAPAMAAHQAQVLATTRQAWADSVMADPELGGQHLQSTLASAQAAMKQFATPGLTQLLNETGLGNHPEMVRAFAKMGRELAEDRFVTGASPSGPRDAASILYGSGT